MKLLSVEPAMYGRGDAGQTSVSTTNQPADTVNAASAPSRCSSRRRSEVGAATRYATPSAGITINPSSILAKNAKPSATPAKAIQRALACSSARTVQYALATISSTMAASGLLKRNINAATGVRASVAAASSPAEGPLILRTAP